MGSPDFYMCEECGDEFDMNIGGHVWVADNCNMNDCTAYGGRTCDVMFCSKSCANECGVFAIDGDWDNIDGSNCKIYKGEIKCFSLIQEQKDTLYQYIKKLKECPTDFYNKCKEIIEGNIK